MTHSITVVAQVPMGVAIVLAQCLRGAGATREAFAIATAGSFAVRIAATALFVPVMGLGLAGVWVTVEARVCRLRAGGAVVFSWQLRVPAASLERSWPQALANLFTLAVGIAVVRSARSLAARLDHARD